MKILQMFGNFYRGTRSYVNSYRPKQLPEVVSVGGVEGVAGCVG